jgi:hypothetical protein
MQGRRKILFHCQSEELLSSLEEDGSYSKNQFLNVSHDFYSTALQYLNAWGVHFDDVHHAECMLLKIVPQREKIEETVHFFYTKADVSAIDEDSLFDEMSSIKAFVTKENIKEWDMNNANTCARWSGVFSHFSEKMVPYLRLQRLVEISLCLPGSNASVERVFSAMNMIWTSQRSRLCLQTIKSMLTVLTNIPMTCQQFAAKLGSRQDILKKVHSSGKNN